MPTYEYACRDCEEHFEIVQSFSEDALTTCPACEGRLRKVFSAAGLIFKGSGWHIKDYSTSSRSTASGSSSDSSDGTSTKSDSGTKTTPSTDSKPSDTSTSGTSNPKGSSSAASTVEKRSA